MEVVLGENIKETRTGDGRRKLQAIRDTFHYIPVIPVLERLLNQYDVFVQVGTSKQLVGSNQVIDALFMNSDGPTCFTIFQY